MGVDFSSWLIFFKNLYFIFIFSNAWIIFVVFILQQLLEQDIEDEDAPGCPLPSTPVNPCLFEAEVSSSIIELHFSIPIKY